MSPPLLPSVYRTYFLTVVLTVVAACAFGQKKTAPESHCDQVERELTAKRYREAYRLAITYTGSDCEASRWQLLVGEALILTGRYDEGLEKLEVITGEKADSLRAYVKRIQNPTDDGIGFTVSPSPLSDTTANNLIVKGAMGEPIVLHGKDRTVSEFPIKRKHSNIYRAPETGEHTPKDPLLQSFLTLPAKGVFQLGPGSMLPDSTVIVTGQAGGSLRGSGGLTLFRVVDGKSPETFSVPFPEHTYAHPVVSPDGTKLIVSSDMPGGFGGMDLWVVTLGPDGPGEWKNAGPSVNSPANEVFPAFVGDTLYFASDDPRRSLGGYDLFVSPPPHEEVHNPGPPLNTVYDEINPVGMEGRLRYFVSNRSSLMGLDEIFDVKPVDVREVFEVIYGHIEADLKRGTEVQLVNNDGAILDRAYVGEDGRFSFVNVKGGESYRVILPDDSLAAGDELFIYDSNKTLVKQVRSTGGNSFYLELLTPMDYLLDKVVNKDESVLTVDILGLLQSKGDKKEGVNIILQDSNGNVVGRTSTSVDGGFRFEDVSPDTRYSIRTDVTDPEAVIHIYNDRGELLEKIAPTRGGEFVYVRLKDDERTITITNEERKKITISKDESFMLPSIYYELNRAELTGKSARTLDKLIEILRENQHIDIELSGHTDSRGSAEYNLLLSEQRIQSVVDYLVGSGILRSRIVGRGYGESRLLNHCSDGVDCTEEEHSVNRRTELKIIEKTY